MFKYLVTFKDFDGQPMKGTVEARSPRQAAAWAHTANYVSSPNTYTVKPVVGIGVSTQTLTDMQAYLQVESEL